MKTILCLTGLVVFASCLSFAQGAKDMKTKLRDKILGTWRIEGVYEKNKEVSPPDSTSISEREFDIESHYKSRDGQGTTIDSGSYRISESHGLLYLESRGRYESASTDPKNSNQETWVISFQNDTMIMGMRGPEGKYGKQFRYVYRKMPADLSKKPNPYKQ
jgi:hypothetical protein